MRSFYILFVQECKKLFWQPGSYFIAAFFLILMGFNYVYILFDACKAPCENCSLESLFETFWFPTLFILPLLTMRIFSEEYRLGLLESLLTTPISTRSLVISKFLTTYLFYNLLWLLCLAFPYFTQAWLGDTLATTFVENSVLTGGCLFIALTSFLFVSIGVFTSSLTHSQTLAGLLCFGILFILFIGFRVLCECLGPQHEIITYVQFQQTLSDFCTGILDFRPCIFYICSGIIFLGLTTLVLDHKSIR